MVYKRRLSTYESGVLVILEEEQHGAHELVQDERRVLVASQLGQRLAIERKRLTCLRIQQLTPFFVLQKA